MKQQIEIVAIVPAAGVGRRLGLALPKQYLVINEQTLLEHTVYRLLAHKLISQVVVVISAEDDYFATTSLAKHANVSIAYGGKERADSVLAGLKATNAKWVMVHDAARPCVRHSDIDDLINTAKSEPDGAILAIRARDTIKQACGNKIMATLDRQIIWHALTPQMFRRKQLLEALNLAKQQSVNVTDEASAIEFAGGSPALVCGHSDNIKVTLPEDLALATYFLSQKKEEL